MKTTVKDLMKENEDQEVYVHLAYEPDSNDCLVNYAWQGWLKDVPGAFLDDEVIDHAACYTDQVEKGINGHAVSLRRKK
jgi:hypothetical protein